MVRETEKLRLESGRVQREAVDWATFNRFKTEVDEQLSGLETRARDYKAWVKADIGRVEKEFQLKLDEFNVNFHTNANAAVKD